MRDMVEIQHKQKESRPCVFGDGAKSQFEKWGFEEELINRLTKEILPRFDYSNCLDKVKRMAKHPVLIDPSSKKIILRFVYDIMGRGDGQCGDLADQLLMSGDFQSWLEDVNASRTKKITAHFLNGNSKTHFSVEGTTHIFLGLSDNGSNIDHDGLVVVDPSFGVVQSLKESGYIVKGEVKNRAISVSRNLHFEGTPGKITKLAPGLQSVELNPGLVLGVSNDYNHAYSLYFVENTSSKKISTALLVREASSGTFLVWLDPDNNHIRCNKLEKYEQLSPESQREIFNILSVTDNFTYIEQPSESVDQQVSNLVTNNANITF